MNSHCSLILVHYIKQRRKRREIWGGRKENYLFKQMLQDHLQAHVLIMATTAYLIRLFRSHQNMTKQTVHRSKTKTDHGLIRKTQGKMVLGEFSLDRWVKVLVIGHGSSKWIKTLIIHLRASKNEWEQHWTLLEWPAMSPDLNPAENQRKETCSWGGDWKLKNLEASVGIASKGTHERSLLIRWICDKRTLINLSN